MIFFDNFKNNNNNNNKYIELCWKRYPETIPLHAFSVSNSQNSDSCSRTFLLCQIIAIRYSVYLPDKHNQWRWNSNGFRPSRWVCRGFTFDTYIFLLLFLIIIIHILYYWFHSSSRRSRRDGRSRILVHAIRSAATNKKKKKIYI